MVVDFDVKKVPACKVAAISYVGPYTGQNMLRKEFGEIAKWAKTKKIETGHWYFTEIDGPEVEDKKRRWQAAIELKGPAKSFGRIKVRDRPAETIAFIRFNPDRVSPRVIYHGLDGWLDAREKDKKFKVNGHYREAYPGDPWKDPRAWARLEVQVPVQKFPRKK